MLNQYDASIKAGTTENIKTASEPYNPKFEGIDFKEADASIEKYSKQYGVPFYKDPEGKYWSVPFYSIAHNVSMIDPNSTSCFECCGCADEHIFNPDRTLIVNRDSLISDYHFLCKLSSDKKITTFNISVKKCNIDNKNLTSLDMFKEYLIAEFGAEAINNKPEQTYQMER